MAKLDIALELGTSFTSIFVQGNNIVLHEPSAIAFYEKGNGNSLCAVGGEAYDLLGKGNDKTKIVCPIVEGVIKYPDECALMLGEFIKRVLPESYVFKPRIRAILGMPTGVSVDQRRMYEDVLRRAGINEVTMVDNCMLAAIGAELNVRHNYGGTVVSIGGGVTEMAVVGLCGLIDGMAMNVGGDMMDRALLDMLCGYYHMNIGKSSTRKLKEHIASLIRNDCMTERISGKDIQNHRSYVNNMSADLLYPVLYDYYMNIIHAVSDLVNSCSPAIVAEIQNSGITVVGGGAKIPGLAELMSKQLGLAVTVADSPEYATVYGAGKLLSNDALLNEILDNL